MMTPILTASLVLGKPKTLTQWTQLASSITALCPVNMSLYAAMGNGTAGVSRFNGTTWAAGTGLAGVSIDALCAFGSYIYAGQSSDGRVYRATANAWARTTTVAKETGVVSLCVYGGKLYAGTCLGGKVQAYDGSKWSLSYDSPESYASAMCVYDGILYVGTANRGTIYQYDGSAWSVSLPAAASGLVYAMAVFNGKLYAAAQSGNLYVFDGVAWTTALRLTGQNIRGFCLHEGVLCFVTEYTGNRGRLYAFDGQNIAVALTHPGPESTAFFTSLCVYDNALILGDSAGRIYKFA